MYNRNELGTWGFLRPGWWVMHVGGIAAVGILGYALKPKHD